MWDGSGVDNILMSLVVTRSLRAFQLLLILTCQQEDREGKLGGDTARTADPSDIPCHMTSRSAYKAGERRRKRGTFGVIAFVFPSNCYT